MGEEEQEVEEITETTSLKILSLGDSYTIGEGVCASCKFPQQLVDSLESSVAKKYSFPLKIIAKTGWTTTNLINAIQSQNIDNDFNLVTLLIGVNNQYQGLNFSIYETEFPLLVDIAVKALSGNKEKLIVVSIPDYAFTPFGNGNTQISQDILKYNNFARAYCTNNGITFVNITDITQAGLENPNYVASDGLHPSKEAYKEFVKRLFPVAIQKLGL